MLMECNYQSIHVVWVACLVHPLDCSGVSSVDDWEQLRLHCDHLLRQCIWGISSHVRLLFIQVRCDHICRVPACRVEEEEGQWCVRDLCLSLAHWHRTFHWLQDEHTSIHSNTEGWGCGRFSATIYCRQVFHCVLALVFLWTGTTQIVSPRFALVYVSAYIQCHSVNSPVYVWVQPFWVCDCDHLGG